MVFSQVNITKKGLRFLYHLSDFRLQPWLGTIAITTLLEFCSWLELYYNGGEVDANMTKQYKGRTATIEIDEKNVIIKSSGFFSSSKKTIPLRDIKNVELSASSFFSKDTVEIYYGSNVEKVQFSNSADAKQAATDITDIARKNRRTSPLGELTGLATSLFGIGVSVASAIKEDQERQRKREIQKAEAEYKKAVDDFLNSGKLTTTTYVNGREFNRPTAKDDIEAVFIAEYAKSPRTAEQPWSQK